MPRLVTFFVWLLLAVTAAYWALGVGKVSGPNALPVVAPPPSVDSSAVARLLGQRDAAAKAPMAPSPVVNTRYKLAGVISVGDRASGKGAALIAVDDKPARPYRVGSELEGGVVLQSVLPRAALLGAADEKSSATGEGGGGSGVTTIELPPLEQGGLNFGPPS